MSSFPLPAGWGELPSGSQLLYISFPFSPTYPKGGSLSWGHEGERNEDKQRCLGSWGAHNRGALLPIHMIPSVVYLPGPPHCISLCPPTCKHCPRLCGACVKLAVPALLPAPEG